MILMFLVVSVILSKQNVINSNDFVNLYALPCIILNLLGFGCILKENIDPV